MRHRNIARVVLENVLPELQPFHLVVDHQQIPSQNSKTFGNKIFPFSFTILIVILVTQITFSQPEYISYFSNQNLLVEQEFIPSAACENNGELFLFHQYSSRDSLYFSKSTDGGITWGEKKHFYAGPRFKQNIDVIITNSGRIIIVAGDGGRHIFIVYSDDNGVSWSEPNQIFLVYDECDKGLNISQLSDGRVIISLGANSSAYYFESFNDGSIWGGPFRYTENSDEVWDLNIISINSSTLLSTYSIYENENWNIRYKVSTDNGTSWDGPSGSVADSDLDELNPKLIRMSDSRVYILYNITHPTEFDSVFQTDLYLKIFRKSPYAWISKQKITNYLGTDDLSDLTEINSKVFYTLSSNRSYNHQSSIWYGINEISIDTSPPAIYKVLVDTISFKDSIGVKAYVDSDYEIMKVKSVFEDDTYIELFDDGLHNDGMIGDKIFGNKFIYNSGMINAYDVVNVNNFFLPVSNIGSLASSNSEQVLLSIEAMDSRNTFSSFLSSNQIPWGKLLGSYQDKSILYRGGFFLSGYNGTDLWANGVAGTLLIEDYIPGNVNSDSEDASRKIYTVKREDIPFGYSWQNWGDAVSVGAKFYDGDKDGIYNPVDKNWNGTWDRNEDMPYLLGDVTIWCSYNDGVPSFLRRNYHVEPLGIKITQSTFASSQKDLQNVVFIKYNIVNAGSVSETLDTVMFGIFVDPDLGYWADDMDGCDTLLNSGFCYNNGNDQVFGSNPPSLFVSLLQGPRVLSTQQIDTAYNMNGIQLGAESFLGYRNVDLLSFNGIHIGDAYLMPSNSTELRNYMKGFDRVGDIVDPCFSAYGEVRGGVNCDDVNYRLWFSGDPVRDYGWINTQHSDKIMLINSEPFTLDKDKPQDIIIAYVLGRGIDPINSITVARENVRKAIEEYKSNFASMTYSPPPPSSPVNNYVLYNNYPNPFNPTTTIRYELPQDGIVTIDVYDILGQKVNTILNEYKQADRYEVRFNASGLASGVYIYRMRINDFVESKKMILLR